jgi:hypothetical protein
MARVTDLLMNVRPEARLLNKDGDALVSESLAPNVTESEPLSQVFNPEAALPRFEYDEELLDEVIDVLHRDHT